MISKFIASFVHSSTWQRPDISYVVRTLRHGWTSSWIPPKWNDHIRLLGNLIDGPFIPRGKVTTFLSKSEKNPRFGLDNRFQESIVVLHFWVFPKKVLSMSRVHPNESKDVQPTLETPVLLLATQHIHKLGLLVTLLNVSIDCWALLEESSQNFSLGQRTLLVAVFEVRLWKSNLMRCFMRTNKNFEEIAAGSKEMEWWSDWIRDSRPGIVTAHPSNEGDSCYVGIQTKDGGSRKYPNSRNAGFQLVSWADRLQFQ